ncbi:hypothetical protein QLQ12_22030 [Actinoplanes sp. NEAU-A12]|uniref:O-antigen polysaccharide polymerase Wzy n=1 Tax=Actinoplanes sandaracinus TaxID=3045177 RepID=A0ABT6WNL5_9ACTN|nr:hypothetical protein [Actinoplanes sandaracinus]MDI6101298.1 hypothetical protein [Actinoplanes sandaracinus]
MTRRPKGSTVAIGSAVAAWAAAGVGMLAVRWLIGTDARMAALGGLSAVCVVFGLWIFWSHDGNRITAVGVYNFSFALFVGFAGLYHTFIQPPGPTLDLILTAVSWAYFLHLVTWAIFWAGHRPEPERPFTVNRGSPAVVWWGLALLSTAIWLVGEDAGTTTGFVLAAIAFAGTALIGAGLILRAEGWGWVVCGVTTAAAVAAYTQYFFTGFGRIVLASLGFTFLIVLSHRTRGRIVKLVVLVGAVPALTALAALRVALVAEMRNGTQENGFESIVHPLYQFARLLALEDAGSVPHAWGQTFWAAVVALVPRRMWPEKPVGLGADLVPVLRPGLIGTNHSEVALYLGEWLFNFGIPGLFFVPSAGILLRILDRYLVSAASSVLDRHDNLIRYTLASVAAAGVIDVLWAGSFSYASRTGSHVVILLAVLLVFQVFWSSARDHRDRPRSPARGSITGRVRPSAVIRR